MKAVGKIPAKLYNGAEEEMTSGRKNLSRVRLNEDLFDRVKTDAKAHFLGARGSHGWDHTERVYELCLRIGGKEKADLNILRLAAVLHDIGRKLEDQSNGKVCHSRKGARLAERILKRYSFDKGHIARIGHCIRTHRFRGKNVPRSLEAKVLFDADKLDSIGAVGIGRAFLFAGEIGASLHNPRIDVLKTQPYTSEDTAYREFLVKLSRVKDRMFTNEGKRIAAERHKFMVEFFKRLTKEVNGQL
jgi:uncharacterized protein